MAENGVQTHSIIVAIEVLKNTLYEDFSAHTPAQINIC